MSCADILSYLYENEIRIYPNDPFSPNRDRLMKLISLINYIPLPKEIILQRVNDKEYPKHIAAETSKKFDYDYWDGDKEEYAMEDTNIFLGDGNLLRKE